MSSSFTLSLDQDVPPAAVEIVAHDLHTMKRLLLRSGRTERIETEAPARFIRMHLSNGRVVTIPCDGPVQITREMISPSAPVSAHGVDGEPPVIRRRFGMAGLRTATELAGAMWNPEGHRGTLRPSAWLWTLSGGKRGAQEGQWVFAGDSKEPFELRGSFARSSVRISIPGNTQTVSVRTDPRDATAKRQSINIISRSPVGDMLLGYLQNGQLGEAGTALEFADRVFQPRITDPFAASIAGYLLLRFHESGRIERHLETFMQQFPDLADPSIIYASHLILTAPERLTEIREALDHALHHKIPVYTEGLRLLIDGLLASGEQGRERVAQLRHDLGHVSWQSPVTTLLLQADSPTVIPRITVTCGVDPDAR